MKKLLTVFIALLVAASFGCESKKEEVKAAAPAGEIVIGIQGPETGNLAVYGKQTLAGAVLAVDEINAAGGLNGLRVKLINYDSRGDKAEAANATQRLINSDKACAIIGEPTSGATFVIGPIADQAGTALISAGATAKGVTDGKPFVFRDTLLDSDGGPQTLKFVMDAKGWKKFAVITSVNNDYSVGLSEIFKSAAAANNATIVAEQTISDGDTDFSAQITALKGAGAEAVIFSGYYPEGSLLLLEMRKQGMNTPLIGGDGLLAPDLWNVAKDAALGSIVYAGFSPEAKTENVQGFVKKMAERNLDADMFSAQGYDAVVLIANAIKASGLTSCADKAQRAKMRDSLAATADFNGVSGSMSFDAEGNAVKKPFIQEVSAKEGGYFFKLLNE